MKKHQLSALVAVAEHGSIRRAALSLALSQTALTKALRELELDLQAALLLRSPQGVRLTPVGLKLLGHAKRILAEIDDARSSVRQMLGQGDAPVKVAVTPTFSLVCLADTVAHFHTRHPAAALSIRDAFLSQTLPMLREGTIDLAITALMPEALGADLAFEPLGLMDVALTGSIPGLPPEPQPLAALAQAAPWLLDSSPGGTSEVVRQWLVRHHISGPRQTIECPSAMASLVLASQGLAIAPTPKPILSVGWVAAPELPVIEPLPSVPIGLVQRKGHRLDAPAEWFAECARLAIARMLARA